MVDFNGSVTIGDFNSGKLQNTGIKIQPKYCFFGEFVDGKMDGLVVVQSFEKNEYKECSYEEGKLVQVEKEEKGQY